MNTAGWIAVLLGVLVFGLVVGYRLNRWTSNDSVSFVAEVWRLRAIHAQQENAALEEHVATLEEHLRLSREVANELLERQMQK
jgi:hypothetical protein